MRSTLADQFVRDLLEERLYALRFDKGLQPPAEVVGGDEVGEMPNELIVGFVVISLGSRP